MFGEKITQSSYFLSKAQKVTFKKHWDSRLNSRVTPKLTLQFLEMLYLLKGRKNSEAISHYKMAIKLNPDFAEAYNNLGSPASCGTERLSEAISHYKMAIKLKPDFADAHYNLGVACLLKTGRLRKRFLITRWLLSSSLTSSKAYNNLGNALSAERKIEEAISHYKMAIKLKPDFALAHNNLGSALVAEGKNEEAISHYKMAIKLKPDYAEGI